MVGIEFPHTALGAQESCIEEKAHNVTKGWGEMYSEDYK